MDKINFIERVDEGPFGEVSRVVAMYGGEEAHFEVVGGVPVRCPSDSGKAVKFDPKIFSLMRRQVTAAVSTHAERAEKLAKELRKPNWTPALKTHGINILNDGRLEISRWVVVEKNARKRIWQTVSDVNAAIRMQDHIVESYLEKAAEKEAEFDGKIYQTDVLNRLAVVRPTIEMRRELLVFSRSQMETSVTRTVNGLKLLLKADGLPRERCHGVPKKLERLSFFLRNHWISPFKEKIDIVMPLIGEAKKASALNQWDRTESQLSQARDILVELIENFGTKSRPARLTEIDPIEILAEVHKYGLEQEVLQLAKKHLAPPYYFRERGLFRLSAMLAVSRLVIRGETITGQEQIAQLIS